MTKQEQFETLAKPLIKFLNDEYHPHVTIIITPGSAEILEGALGFTTEEFFKG